MCDVFALTDANNSVYIHYMYILLIELQLNLAQL